MVFRVQYLMVDTGLTENSRKILRRFDRGRSHQNRLLLVTTVLYTTENSAKFFTLSTINQVWLIIANHRHVGRYDHHLKSINLLEFHSFSVCSTRHTGQLIVQPEQVLEGNRCEGLIFLLNWNTFFGFYSLVKAFSPTPPCHHTPGELIDNHDLTIANDVIDITLKQGVGTQCCIQMMHQTDVANIIETRSLVQQPCLEQHRFGAFVAVFSQKDLLVLLIDREITWTLFFILSHQFWDDVIDLHIQISTVVGRTRYDQWCSGFIDQDGVHFVYDSKIA